MPSRSWLQPADTKLLLARTRAGLWLILACIGFFALIDAGIPLERFRPAYALKAANVTVVLAFIVLLHRRPHPRVAWWTAVCTVNLSYLLFAAGDLVKGHEATAPLLSLTCSLAAAALLPWGLGAQITTAVVTTLGTIVVQRLAGASWTALLDPAASMLAAQVVAIYVVIELDRFRRDRRRVEGELSGRARTEGLRAQLSAAFAEPRPSGERLRRSLEVIAGGLDASVAAVVGFEPGGAGAVRALTGLPESDGPLLARTARAVRAGGPAAVTLTDQPELHAAWALRHGLRYLTVDPLTAGGRTNGLLVLAAARPLDDQTRARATAMADTLASGLVHLGVEEARATLLAELERANQVKTEFVSTMSHELRTPLNVIMGYTEMLDDPACTDPAFALARIRQANGELLELIEATLDLNRLETGRDEPSYGDVAMAELWTELAGEFAPAAHRAGLRLDWSSEPHLSLRTDRRKLKTIIKNLVGNALKFTNRGGVHVAATEGGGHCVVSVQDSGVGIPAEALPHIWEMFRQVDSSDRRSYGGVGLGLHIVQRLCRQLGAEVSVTSRPGRGTTFTVRLPLAPRVICAA